MNRQDINEIIAATFPLGEYSVYVEGGAKSNDPINLSNEGTVCAKKETIGLLVNKMNITTISRSAAFNASGWESRF